MFTKVLLLQGPIGPFFRRLSKELRQQGNLVYKVNFNAGDRWFYSDNKSIDFTGRPESWEEFLIGIINKYEIDRVYVFGDCREYHQVAREVTRRMGVRFFVFEEGYLRPDYITLEEDGVNGHTSITFPHQKSKGVVSLRPPKVEHQHFKGAFHLGAWYAIQYYIAAVLMRSHYPFYVHHRPMNILGEGGRWLLSGWRKLRMMKRSSRSVKVLMERSAGAYFLVPLQVHVDMQVLKHSRFRSVEEFIEVTIRSFAAHSRDDISLVFKHHPMDRGYRDYTKLIQKLMREYGLKGRLFYVFDSHLPTLLKHAAGTVTINSTVGLSSLHHGTPVKAMGSAIYDLEGLTFQQELDLFWNNPGEVDHQTFQQFRQHLLDTNQINGSFYQRRSKLETPTGMVWSPYLRQLHCRGRKLNVSPKSGCRTVVKISAA
jgi:capsule polysaccharide modification protein KpsS